MPIGPWPGLSPSLSLTRSDLSRARPLVAAAATATRAPLPVDLALVVRRLHLFVSPHSLSIVPSLSLLSPGLAMPVVPSPSLSPSSEVRTIGRP